MSHLPVIIISLFSAAIFDRLPMPARIMAMRQELANSLSVLQSASLSDDEKQKRLLSISGKLLMLTAQLALLLALVVFPFIVIFVVEKYWSTTLNISAILVTVQGLAFCTLGFLSYFLIKKGYEHFRL